jgi:hypothetical protein
MKYFGIILLAGVLLAGCHVYAQSTNTTTNTYAFYTTHNINKASEATMLKELTDRVAHIQSILDKHGKVRRQSYIGKPFFDAKQCIKDGEIDYAMLHLKTCEDRLKSEKMWVPRKTTTVTYTPTTEQ